MYAGPTRDITQGWRYANLIQVNPDKRMYFEHETSFILIQFCYLLVSLTTRVFEKTNCNGSQEKGTVYGEQPANVNVRREF